MPLPTRVHASLVRRAGAVGSLLGEPCSASFFVILGPVRVFWLVNSPLLGRLDG